MPREIAPVIRTTASTRSNEERRSQVKSEVVEEKSASPQRTPEPANKATSDAVSVNVSQAGSEQAAADVSQKESEATLSEESDLNIIA